MNNKADNQDASRFGDRTLSAWLNNGGFYHFPTYTYTDMNAGGNTNSVQNMPHDNLHQAWHFIYYGYSKTEKRAFVFV
jgi:hypothetical protein